MFMPTGWEDVDVRKIHQWSRQLIITQSRIQLLYSWTHSNDPNWDYFYVPQYSIAALKELQFDGCGKDRRRVLEKWDTIAVWDLDLVCLTRILKFYNSTNHLNYTQPTWGNQIVSGMNICIANGRPTDKAVEAKVCGNRAVQNIQAYSVSFLNYHWLKGSSSRGYYSWSLSLLLWVNHPVIFVSSIFDWLSGLHIPQI
jgi:hypothetical protein